MAQDLSSIIATTSPLSVRKHIARVEEAFPEAMDILRKLGIHPSLNTEFSNIGHHSIAVHLVAMQLAARYFESNLIDYSQVREIGQRSLLHDACKVFNIKLDAARKNHEIGREDYIAEDSYEPFISEIVSRGIERSLAVKLVHDYGSEAGASYSALSKFIAVTMDDLRPVLVPGEIVIKCVHAADDMVASPIPEPSIDPVSYILTTEERLFVANADEKSPWGWFEGLGINAAGKLVTVQNVFREKSDLKFVRSSHAYMAWVTTKINEEFCRTFFIDASKEGPDRTVKRYLVTCLEKSGAF